MRKKKKKSGAAGNQSDADMDDIGFQGDNAADSMKYIIVDFYLSDQEVYDGEILLTAGIEQS